MRLDLIERAANFMDMSVAYEAGSCPYLLAWDAKERDWVNHGKVLHKAPSKADEYIEAKSFSGFQSQFRIEEREPEVAFIDHAELVVELKTGETITLKPDNPSLAARDNDYLRLYWGDRADIAFVLPDGITKSDVTQSRFLVTGYYRRYSSLLAQGDRRARPQRPAGSAWRPQASRR